MADAVFVASTVTGMLFALLGLAVFAIAPRSPANQGFALYALGSGGSSAGLALALLGLFEPGYPLLGLYAVSVVGLVRLATRFPRRLAPEERPLALACAAFAALYFGLWAAWSWVWHAGGVAAGDFSDMSLWWASLVEAALRSALWGALLLFALRYRGEAAWRPSYAVMTAAIVLEHAYRAGDFLTPFSSFPSPLESALRLALPITALGLFTLAWLWNTTLPGPRWIPALPALALLGALLAQMDSFIEGGLRAWLVAISLAHLAGGALIAFAIARGQVPGLETRVRWGVTHGAVAAAFIACFFLVSELAQQYLGERSGSAYVGIAATGALVFLLAPLQRAADRFAQRVVPADAVQVASTEREAAYRSALRLALRDRALSRDEERELVVIASRLGIAPERAFQLRDEVERAAA